MILYEHEGKTLLRQTGLKTPHSQLLTLTSPPPKNFVPLVLKAQTLIGKRARNGGVVKVHKPRELASVLAAMFNRRINDAPIETILAEEWIDYKQAWYLSLAYNTSPRGLVLSWSADGGTGIEERGAESVIINPLAPQLPTIKNIPPSLLRSLLELFLQEDCLLLEINPLVFGWGSDGEKDWYALDAKVRLDDTAAARHLTRTYPPRAEHLATTARELAAKQIDASDYRGVAGSTYFDLSGDIAILASGGGASLLAVDALVVSGGAPANYTEYSGNPTREKVEKLTELVLDKPHLNGLWVVGAMANFTDIFETLSGVLGGLRRVRSVCGRPLNFPIVVRRGGPRAAEAFALLQSATDFDFHLFGPEISISKSAKLMTKLARAHMQKNNS